MLSALAWVPRGASARVPRRQELSKEEVDAIARKDHGGGGGDDGADDGGYDDADGDEMAMQASGRPEDYAEAPAGPGEEDDEEDEEDAADLEARATDAFVVVANTEDDFSSLEVHCYNEADGSLYTHHDVTLPSFPLCLAWSDYAGDEAGALLRQTGCWAGEAREYVGSYVAVGTFEPDIEIWNLDVLDPLEPTLVLRGSKGGAAAAAAASSASSSSAAGGGKKQKGRGGGKKGAGVGCGAGEGAGAGAGGSGGAGAGAGAGHSAAVMGLSWNRTFRHLLASSSADKTVKVWDLDGGGRLLHSFDHHKGKVQQVAWNPTEATVLAAASYDGTCSVTDARESEKRRVARYALTADPESLQWNHLLPATFIVSTSDGKVTSFDCRLPDRPLWQIQAHAQSVTAVALSATADGLMATASLDKSVRLWDTAALMGADASAGAAQPLSRKAMSIGQLFTCSFYSGSPFLLAAGGSKGVLAVWDISEDGGEGCGGGGAAGAEDDGNEVTARFAGRVRDTAAVPSLALRPRVDGQPTS